MIQENFGQKCEVLAVGRVLQPIYFEHGNVVNTISVYFIPRGMVQFALQAMPLELRLEGEKAETELTDVQALRIMEIWRNGAKVPGF